MKRKDKTNKNRTAELLMSAALAGILGAATSYAGDNKATGAATAEPDQSGEKVSCYGVNSCKGKSACNTATNSCAGQNSCKGKGWLEMTKKECLKKHGKLTEPKAG